MHKGLLFSLALKNEGELNDQEIICLLNDSNAHSLNSLSEANDFIYSHDPTIAPLTETNWDSAKFTVSRNIEAGVNILSICDDRYPKFLKTINDPPALLYLKGNIDILKRLPGVAIIGTRKATLHGKEIAKRLATYFSEEGWVVISGLALGIDAAAHQGALLGKGGTIAVLAHGLHKASPKQNSSIAKEILDNGGAWISEHPVLQEPRKWFFVPRNRIQVGLSAGSIIVEAEEKSGSTTQASFCLKNGRELFAVVPHDESNSLKLLYRGTKMLVDEKGAIPIKGKEDYPMIKSLLEKVRSKII